MQYERPVAVRRHIPERNFRSRPYELGQILFDSGFPAQNLKPANRHAEARPPTSQNYCAEVLAQYPGHGTGCGVNFVTPALVGDLRLMISRESKVGADLSHGCRVHQVGGCCSAAALAMGIPHIACHDWHSRFHSLVAGTNKRSKDGLDRGVDGMDAGRIRLHYFPPDHGPYRAGV